MSIKRYIKLMFFADCLCWLAFIIVLFAVDPVKSGAIGFILFYLSLLFAFIGLLALIGLIIRGHFSSGPVHPKVITSFRQAIWFSALIIFFLFLQGLRVLRWWNLVIFILFLALLEFFFISHRSQSQQ